MTAHHTKRQFSEILLIVSLFLWPSLQLIAQGYLKAEGTAIVNENGEEVIFRGIGLGGWMLQEGYMLGTSGPQHVLEARIENLVGPTRKAQFYDAWLANHTRKIDVDSMAAWGYNMIRLPMHYKLFTPPIEEEPVPGEITWIDKGFEMTDQLLDWCKQNDIYLILDLHAAPGGQGENADINDYDDTKPSLWESDANKTKMIALWRRLAERYADEPMIAGYDIINEPNWGFQNHESDPNGCAESQNTPLWDLQKDITEAIREVDENHIIIIEGNCWGNNYSGLPTLWDDNLVISFHKYWNANTVDAIQGMLDMRSSRNVPIWLGETGENSNTWFTNAITLFESNNFGWSWWPLKKQGYNNPLQVVRNPGYQDILNFWNNNGPQPSADDAFAALMQLAENLKLENNTFHPSVVDAMIRQPHSDEAIPFKPYTIAADATTIIYATDFDMGKHDIAYHDNEVSNTTGNAGGLAWNQGYAYRNDGVDIQACQDEESNGYNVGWTEDGEWMQYTVQVEESGNYRLSLRTASSQSGGRISVMANGILLTQVITLPNTGGYQTWASTEIEDVPLTAGTNVIRLTIETGGFNLNYMAFTGPVALSEQQPSLIQGTGEHGKKKIELIFNQDFNPIPNDPDFLVTYNGSATPVTNAYLSNQADRIITLEVEDALNYGDEILVSYLGNTISTATGVVLDTFLNEPIFLTLEGGLLPIAIPGRVEAEDFAVNNGFVFEETSDTGGGQNAAYTDFGDYLDFLVYAEQAGDYRVDFRISSESTGGSIRLQLVENATTTNLALVNFGATGGWQNWTTVSKDGIFLEQGIHTIRVLAVAQLFNINWLNFSLPALSTVEPEEANLVIYPNPGKDSLSIRFNNLEAVPEKVTIYNMEGRKLRTFNLDTSTTEFHFKHNLVSGQYLLVFEKNGKQISKKFLVK